MSTPWRETFEHEGVQVDVRALDTWREGYDRHQIILRSDRLSATIEMEGEHFLTLHEILDRAASFEPLSGKGRNDDRI